MRFVMVVVVLVLAVLLWQFAFREKKDFFIKEPVKSTELNFENPYSEDVYVNCVTIENLVLKANQIRGCPVNSKTYPGLLKKSKAYCRCVATDKGLLALIEKQALGLPTKHALYEKALKHADAVCVPIKGWSR